MGRCARLVKNVNVKDKEKQTKMIGNYKIVSEDPNGVRRSIYRIRQVVFVSIMCILVGTT